MNLRQTCGDIYEHRAVLFVMDKTFGLRGLLRAYLGIASNVVQPGQREERKSIGAERCVYLRISSSHLAKSQARL